MGKRRAGLAFCAAIVASSLCYVAACKASRSSGIKSPERHIRHAHDASRLSADARLCRDPGQQNAEGGEVAAIVKEPFEDFHTTNEITLPARREIRLRMEPSKNFEYRWKIALTSLAQNQLSSVLCRTAACGRSSCDRGRCSPPMGML